jgi:hypothetical protein
MAFFEKENKKAMDSVSSSTHGLVFFIRTFGLGHLGRWADPSEIIIKPPAKILRDQGSVHRVFFPGILLIQT